MEKTQNTKRLIAKTGLFKNASPAVVDDLLKENREKKYTKGECIFSAGDPAKSFFIVLSGWVKLYRLSQEGDEVVINVFGPGESFAEAAVFKEGMTYPVNARAATETRLFMVSRGFFIDKIKKDTTFALNMLSAISARQHTLVQQLEQVTIRSAPQRIGTFLLRFSREVSPDTWVAVLPYNKTLIASRLNIKPETFSRALHKLKQYGVNLIGNKAYIKNKEALALFCDIEE